MNVVNIYFIALWKILKLNLLERFKFLWWPWDIQHYQGLFAPYIIPDPVNYYHAKQSLELMISTRWLPILNVGNTVKLNSYYIPSFQWSPGYTPAMSYGILKHSIWLFLLRLGYKAAHSILWQFLRLYVWDF